MHTLPQSLKDGRNEPRSNTDTSEKTVKPACTLGVQHTGAHTPDEALVGPAPGGWPLEPQAAQRPQRDRPLDLSPESPGPWEEGPAHPAPQTPGTLSLPHFPHPPVADASGVCTAGHPSVLTTPSEGRMQRSRVTATCRPSLTPPRPARAAGASAGAPT